MKPSVPNTLALTQTALGVRDETCALLFGCSVKQWREWTPPRRRPRAVELPALQRGILKAVSRELDRCAAASPGAARNFGLWLEHQLETRPILDVLTELHRKARP